MGWVGGGVSLLSEYIVLLIYFSDLIWNARTCNHAFEPKILQVPSLSAQLVNRQSGGDEAKRIGLVGPLHLSICGVGGGAGFA